jgi:hypothetical protein
VHALFGESDLVHRRKTIWPEDCAKKYRAVSNDYPGQARTGPG